MVYQSIPMVYQCVTWYTNGIPNMRQCTGSGAVTVQHSRRNTKKRYTSRFPALVTRLTYYIRKQWLPWSNVPSRVGVMGRGVTINGREWRRGSFCRYTRDFSGNRGQGATRMGAVVEYYTFYGDNSGQVFVLIREHNVVSTQGVMFVVDAAYQAEHVVHIDNLLFLLHLAPYFNDDPNLKCCLPVATAHPLSLDDMLD